MPKITLIQKRRWNNNGYEGFGYAGFKEGGGVIQFTSQSKTEHNIYPEEIGFNPSKCEDIDLKVKIWDNNVKYSEVVPADND